jgi:hypothetical protein
MESIFSYAMSPWKMRHYVLLNQPQTVRVATRRLASHDRDIEALHERNETAALLNASKLRQSAILQVVGAAATTVAGLRKKCRTLCGVVDDLQPAWLMHPMVAGALKADAARLGLTDADEASITASLMSRLKRPARPA